MEMKSLAQGFMQLCGERPEHEAYILQYFKKPRAVALDSIEERVTAVASILQQYSAEGGKVIVICDTPFDNIIGILACAYARMTAVVVDLQSTLNDKHIAPEIREHYQPECIVTTNKIARACSFSGEVIEINKIDSEEALNYVHPEFLPTDEVIILAGCDQEAITYTNQDLMALSQAYAQQFHQPGNQRILSVRALCEQGSLQFALLPVLHGATVRLMRPLEVKQKPTSCVGVIKNYKITMVAMDLQQYEHCIKARDASRCESLQYLIIITDRKIKKKLKPFVNEAIATGLERFKFVAGAKPQTIASDASAQACRPQATYEINTWLTHWFGEQPGSAGVTADMNFIHLGIDSKTITEFVADVNRWLDIELQPGAVWKYPSINVMSTYLANQVGLTNYDASKRGQETYATVVPKQLPLVHIQDVIWQRAHEVKDSGMLAFGYYLDGHVDEERFAKACRTLVKKHPLLNYIVKQDNNKLHYDRAKRPIPFWSFIDVNKKCAEQEGAMAEALLHEPDLEHEPAIKVMVMRCSDGEILGLGLHQFLFDSLSCQTVIHDLVHYYNHPPEAEIEVDQPTYIYDEWQLMLNESRDERLEFWQNHPVSPFAYKKLDFLRQSDKENFSCLSLPFNVLAADLYQDLVEYGQVHEVDVNTLFLAAYLLQIRRQFNKQSTVMGCNLSLHHEHQEAIGPYFDYLMLQFSTNDEESVASFLNELKTRFTLGVEHFLPLGALLDHCYPEWREQHISFGEFMFNFVPHSAGVSDPRPVDDLQDVNADLVLHGQFECVDKQGMVTPFELTPMMLLCYETADFVLFKLLSRAGHMSKEENQAFLSSMTGILSKMISGGGDTPVRRIIY